MNTTTVSYQIQNETHNWSVKDSANHTLISDIIVKNYLNYNYGSFICADLFNKFDLYNSIGADDLARAIDTREMDYNPIHNYDGKETQINLTSHGKKTYTDDTTKTNTPDSVHNNIKTQYLTGSKTTTETDASQDNYTTTFESAVKRASTSSENGNETTVTPEGGTEQVFDLKTTDEIDSEKTEEFFNVTISKDGKTYSAHDVNIFEMEKGGNLGVTSTQEMIEREENLRLTPIITKYLDKFARTYCYYIYIGGDDEWY